LLRRTVYVPYPNRRSSDLTAEELATYRGLIGRRVQGEPTQYLVGEKHFYNRAFVVDERVLIPRPETELLVDEVLQHLPPKGPSRVLDLCTGSGCIALSIARSEEHT